MKSVSLIFKTFAIVVCIMATAEAGRTSTYSFNYSIHNTSKLVLSGTSNVSDYSCDCNELIQTQKEMLFEYKNDTFTFSNTLLQLKTKSFDCGLSIITGEMHAALEAKKHPKITVQLLSVDASKHANFLRDHGKAYTANGKAKITIAGNSKVVNLKIIAKRINEKQYHFSGTKNLKMTDFGIEPPTPAMGLIKVANEVEIELDLTVGLL